MSDERKIHKIPLTITARVMRRALYFLTNLPRSMWDRSKDVALDMVKGDCWIIGFDNQNCDVSSLSTPIIHFKRSGDLKVFTYRFEKCVDYNVDSKFTSFIIFEDTNDLENFLKKESIQLNGRLNGSLYSSMEPKEIRELAREFKGIVEDTEDIIAVDEKGEGFSLSPNIFNDSKHFMVHCEEIE